MKRNVLVALIVTVVAVSALAFAHWRTQPRDGGAATTRSRQPDHIEATAAVHHGPTEDSARASAITFATASQDWLYLRDDEVERSVRAIATPAAADELSRATVAELRTAREALAKSPGRVWWLVRPLASHVERVDGTNARVVVWTVTVLSASDVAVPQAEWTRVAVDLEWIGASWRVEAIADTPGPTPMTGTKDRPWQPEPFDAALDGFERVGSEVPE